LPVLTGIRALARCLTGGPQDDANVIDHAALVWEGDTIRWVGPELLLPAVYRTLPVEDAGARLVVPGLVDCHTHLAFGGWRAEEFVRRLRGATYLEIAAAGGGIASTVAQTRVASREHLVSRCRTHLAGMARLGVTTVEAKSGYGLTLEDELRLLDVYRELSAGPQRVIPTLLAAHVIPPEFTDRRRTSPDCGTDHPSRAGKAGAIL
jgi:imidazolonepropionase